MTGEHGNRRLYLGVYLSLDEAKKAVDDDLLLHKKMEEHQKEGVVIINE